ncbi:MAG: class I SAM-dependent methyltransferase [Burkholderiales bacterium]|nr:class I SAM-dependent methyltransferase [Burkholderiales bacterium]NDB23459.1 class I SAM-dependent methyltransferase [Burkholderiaceae bacterium]NDG91117.1 class I SAM-dependent methyltransferase [Burkholderiaceae bacterium]
MKMLKAWLAVLGLAFSLNAFAQYPAAGGDDKYQPRLGQEGKDVIWMPTGGELVTLMLKTAKVTPNDLVYDLGAGDGKIAIAAAKEFGARSIGIEFNPDMAAFAQRNAVRAGVGDRVKIINGDIFKEDFSKATVVTLYLLPDLNLKLRPILLKMKPGTRVVSHAFTMGDWEADQEIEAGQRGYFWIVPANVAGDWVIDGIETQNKVVLNLVQRYQRIGGSLTVGGKTQPILNPSLEGDKLSFGYIDRNNNLHNVKLTVNGSQLKGEGKGGYLTNSITGIRR